MDVLMVDDEPHVTRILQRAFERAGWTVRTAVNGLLALEQIEIAEPDVMVTDVEMPRMDGRELCETVAERWPQRGFPIIVMTSHTSLVHRDWSAAIRGVSFLEKPVSLRRLVDTAQACCGNVEQRA